MKTLLVTGVAGLIAALAITIPGALGGHRGNARRHQDFGHGRHDHADHRAGELLREHRGGHARVLQLHQHAEGGERRQAWRLRPSDHLQGRGRRLQPGQHVQKTRRAWSRTRACDGRRAGHRGPAGGARLPEPAESAADLRLHRPQRVRGWHQQYPWTIGWQPDYIQEGIASAATSGRTCRTRRSPCSVRTTTTGASS